MEVVVVAAVVVAAVAVAVVWAAAVGDDSGCGGVNSGELMPVPWVLALKWWRRRAPLAT